MGFTTPCFIRKNTPELRVKLQKLGYVFVPNGYGEWHIPIEKCEYLFCSSDIYRGSTMYYCMGKIYKSNIGVDCGTNEELFLAIAALRDDTDNNQLFTNGKGDWSIYRDRSDGGLPGMDFYGMPNEFDLSHYHKATVDELIEHFKEMEE